MKTETDLVEHLSRAESLRLLGSVPVGRIVFTVRALPAVHPVNFMLDGDEVVIRVGVGSKLAAAVAGAVVAFQADEIDVVARAGWSVTITGTAQMVTDPAEVQWLRRHGPRPWAGGARENFVRIKPELVTGRRIGGMGATADELAEQGIADQQINGLPDSGRTA